MSVEGYAVRLLLTLGDGANRLPERRRSAAAEYFLGSQRPDGGFAGRDGPSDGYYTAFGVRALSIVGGLERSRDAITAGAAASLFVADAWHQTPGLIDRLSLGLADAMLTLTTGRRALSDERLGELCDDMLALRRDDGGFAKSPEGHAGSTYQTFLTLLAHEAAGRAVDDPDGIADFLDARRQADGGYLEIRVGKRSGVNPTAAAVGALRMLGCDDQIDAEATATFLASLQSDDGGLPANTRLPMSDLLSTFTGLWTMIDLIDVGPASDRIDPDAMRRFVESMRAVGGGYHGFAFDEQTDVEYSFYGIAAECLLSLLAPPPGL